MSDERRQLLRLAREAIETSLRGDDVALPDAPFLQVPAAVFVTLRERRDGALRGCIGSLEAHLPLGRAVVTAARAAAFTDPRFAPLSRTELERVRLEINVLSPLAPLPVTDEADAVRTLERTRPGVLLTCGPRQGVLLPGVWESVRDAAEFLGHLKLKAGLPVAFWSESVELQTFTCDEFAEAEAAAAEAR